MTKMRGKSSYFRHINRQHESNLPLLKPLRTLIQRWGAIPPQHRVKETALPVQPSSVKAGKTLQLQDPIFPSTQHVMELQPVVERRVTLSSPPPPSGLHAPVPPADSSPVSKGTAPAKGDQQLQVEIQPAPAKSMHTSSLPQAVELAHATGDQQPEGEIQPAHATSRYTSSSPRAVKFIPPTRDQQPEGEIQLAPAKSARSAAAEKSGASRARRITAGEQTTAPAEKKTASITLRPPPVQQQGAMITSTNSLHPAAFMRQEDDASARVPGPQQSPGAVPHKQEAQQHATIHIGTIDVHIVPPAPPVPLSPVRGSTARPPSTPALSREMTSFIGLRQG